MPDLFDQYSHERPDVHPIIYAYSDTRFPGCLKVGYTTRTIEERMKEHYPTLTPSISYKVEYIESALYPDGTTFLDKRVHAILDAKGFPALKDPESKKTEWYKCSVDDVKAAIIAVKTHTLNLENRTQTFPMRPEQERAVQYTSDYFSAEKKENPSRRPKYLWNCKMRFGKTFATYQLAKKMGMRRVLILTFKPAVVSAWEEDLMTHVDFDGWQFFSRDVSIRTGIQPEDLDQSRPIVCFGSFQDYLGLNEVGGIKKKNEWVHATNWDMVVFDEYHFGAWRENAKKLFENEDEDAYDTLDVEKYQEEEAGYAINESFLPITTDYYLYLSGTPFRSLNNGEFLEDQIYSWTYSDEQDAKENWAGPGKNPYASLPKMVMMTYKIPDSITKIALAGEFNEFDLNLFFAAEELVKGDPTTAQFKEKDYVQKWLDLIRGSYNATTYDELKQRGKGEHPVMPFSDARMLRTLTHTFWFLPNVASCYAMANLLAEPQNTFYHDYHVNVCAGPQAGIGSAAIAPVRASMDPPLGTKTITLSCSKLATGVTIKPWTGIFMLRNLSSPETYFQAAFRVQSPWTIKKEDGSEEILKPECYIFDFAINRALREISEYSCRLNLKEGSPEKKVAEFVHYLPVLAYDGSAMVPVSATDILDFTTAGTSATLLAKRWESALLVNVDNDTLKRLQEHPEAIAALEKIEGFRNLNRDLATIINRSAAIKKAKQEPDDPKDKSKKKDLTQQEKELKSLRREIQKQLVKFATRIPIFMYLTEYREESLKDVITQLEPELFKRVTGLTVQDFELMVSLGLFNDSRMNEAVWRFRRYEDASLEYTGIRRHSDEEDVGLFSTVITREDYEEMAKQQIGSMMTKGFTVAVPSNGTKPKKAPSAGIKVPASHKEKPVMKEEPAPAPKTEVITPTEEVKAATPAAKPEAEAIAEPVVVKIEPGMTVKHRLFGKGTILDIDDGGNLTVKFLLGQKRFQPNAFDKGFLSVVQ